MEQAHQGPDDSTKIINQVPDDNNNASPEEPAVKAKRTEYRQHLQRQHYRAVPIYPGQGGFNPCICCSSCCRGRCTLRTGCYLVAFSLVNIGVVHVAYSFPKVLPLFTGNDSLTEGDVAENREEFRTSIEKYLADIETLFSYFATNPLVSLIIFAWGLIFSIFPGGLLVVAAAKLSRIACFLYAVLMILGMGFLLGTTVTVSAMIVNKQLPFINSDFKIWAIISLWVFAYTTTAVRIYCFLCGYGVFAQLRDGEYNMPKPPKQQTYFIAPDSF